MAGGLRGGVDLGLMILVAGSIVLLFFVVLSGVSHTKPLKQTWFLQADTSSFTGSERALSQWTYFYVCGADNEDCGKPVPALPIGYAWVGSTEGVPAALVGSHAKQTSSTYYFYMWRFGWVMYLLALVFDVFAFFASLASSFSRLASSFLVVVMIGAFFFMTIAASLMTVTFVKMRDVFRSAGFQADIGKWAFGFTWGAWFAMFLATIMLFLGAGLGGFKDHVSSDLGFKYRRNRNRRVARGSLVDSEGGPRVKEEY